MKGKRQRKEKNHQNKRGDVDVSISFHKFHKLMASEGIKGRRDMLQQQIHADVFRGRACRLEPPLSFTKVFEWGSGGMGGRLLL